MRIAFIIDTLTCGTAGTEQQLIQLIKSLDKDVFEPVLICLHESEFLSTFTECPVVVFNVGSMKSPRILLSIFSIAMHLRREGYDVVQTFFRDGNFIGVFAAWLAGVNSIVSARRGQVYWSSKIEFFAISVANMLTSKYISNSILIKKKLIHDEKVPSEKIHLVSNSIDMGKFGAKRGADRARCRYQLGLEDDQPAICLVGNLRPVKRHDLFISAASSVVEEYGNARFFFVGDGPLRSQLEGQTEALSIAENCSFLGKLDDVSEILCAMDVAVLCSDFESCSNALIEYQLFELPAVCTNVGDNAEMVRNGENGYIVEVGDVNSLATGVKAVLGGMINREAVVEARKAIEGKCSEQAVRDAYQTFYLGLGRTQ